MRLQRIILNLKTNVMKITIAYNNNFYPFAGEVIPQAGDNIYIDYDLDGTRFFIVKFRTIDIANKQVILSIVKI